jgi:hypothetical protein
MSDKNTLDEAASRQPTKPFPPHRPEVFRPVPVERVSR